MPSIDLRAKPNRNKRDKRPPREMPFDIALRKFRKAVERAGILQKIREKEFYEKPTAKRKRKKAEAISRWRKQERQMQMNGGGKSPRRRK